MEYSFEIIGNRIRDLRNSKGWNQDRLVEEIRQYCGFSRNTLSKIENGNAESFTLDFLLSCCKIFHCDIGFLMGEYNDCKTKDKQFICDQTGLSEKSIDTLHSLLSYKGGVSRIALINWLLNDPRFSYQLFDHIISYCNRSLRFEEGKACYRSEQFLSTKLSRGDISKEIQLLENGTLQSTITQKELTHLADLKDVSYLKAQRTFDNVLDCLVYNHCKKNGCEIDGAY